MLKELRIQGDEREDHGGGPPKWVWIVGGVVVVLALAVAGGWWWWQQSQVPEVRTANAQAEVSIAEQRRLTTLKHQVELAVEQIGRAHV